MRFVNKWEDFMGLQDYTAAKCHYKLPAPLKVDLGSSPVMSGGVDWIIWPIHQKIMRGHSLHTWSGYAMDSPWP